MESPLKKKELVEFEGEEQILPFQKYDLEAPPAHNATAIRRARNMFIQNYPFERIFLETGVPYNIFIRKQRKWIKLRDKLDEFLLAKMRDEAVVDKAQEFVERGLHIGLKFLDNVIKRNIEIDVKDFKFIMDSVMAIHRVKQLEAGLATDIVAYEHMSPKELREYLAKTVVEVKSKHSEIIEYLPDEKE